MQTTDRNQIAIKSAIAQRRRKVDAALATYWKKNKKQLESKGKSFESVSKTVDTLEATAAIWFLEMGPMIQDQSEQAFDAVFKTIRECLKATLSYNTFRSTYRLRERNEKCKSLSTRETMKAIDEMAEMPGTQELLSISHLQLYTNVQYIPPEE